MPATLCIAQHNAETWSGRPPARSVGEVFKESCGFECRGSSKVIQCSLSDPSLIEDDYIPSPNGFVRAAILAYSAHYHLVLRPEDVWFAILSQLSFFISNHAEELGHLFVTHDGRKEVEVTCEGSLYQVDYASLARDMALELEKHICDPALRTWIMPSFTTTMELDRSVASVIFMGTLQKYFSYKFSLACGIPSVTLLGEKRDWEDILHRVDKISDFGEEPTKFMNLLKPVLRHMVQMFDPEPASAVTDFWGKIAHKTGGSGSRYLSGWITAFCFWNEKGDCLYPEERPVPSATPEKLDGKRAGCELDGVFYHRLDSDEIPCGFASLPVTIDDNGTIHKTRMAAGSIGIVVTSSDQSMAISSNDMTKAKSKPQARRDTLQPYTAWFLYELPSDGAQEESEEDDDLGKTLPMRTNKKKSMWSLLTCGRRG